MGGWMNGITIGRVGAWKERRKEGTDGQMDE